MVTRCGEYLIAATCGQARGIGCDGWRNDIFSPKLTMMGNDYAVLGQLVKSGLVLAYLPDYWLRELTHVHLNVSDCHYQRQGKLLLVSFQKRFIDLFSA